ncbi:hypothetical protein M407DRAFT_96822 [Tulasnella calospora MUT 4182]|uniref:Uncharacterized protein n=1 Tax=Tulasnella calospora MUT 4182 TaxID=1051891 RepID=A0A0C3QH08_9AGAM|nr:hypothetical protein M407DRAFT_96822 [Tulasnella calospora MUT 4182]
MSDGTREDCRREGTLASMLVFLSFRSINDFDYESLYQYCCTFDLCILCRVASGCKEKAKGSERVTSNSGKRDPDRSFTFLHHQSARSLPDQAIASSGHPSPFSFASNCREKTSVTSCGDPVVG